MTECTQCLSVRFAVVRLGLRTALHFQLCRVTLQCAHKQCHLQHRCQYSRCARRRRCRFFKSGAMVPPRSTWLNVSAKGNLNSIVYDGTCMLTTRLKLLKDIDKPSTGLMRPDSGAAPENTASLLTSLSTTFTFFKLQWAGLLPRGAVPAWRQPGFIDLDPATCRGKTYSTSFATGSAALLLLGQSALCISALLSAHDVLDCIRHCSCAAAGAASGSSHSGPSFIAFQICPAAFWLASIWLTHAPRADHIVSTMAVASQTGIVSLGMLWWSTSFTGSTQATAAQEVLRQGEFLASAWDASKPELLVAIGDQSDPRDAASLMTYSDYGAAPRALQAGPPLFKGGVPEPVPPVCTYADATKGAAEVAAHAAAALALASGVVKGLRGGVDETTRTTFIAQAESLLAYSLKLAPTASAKPAGVDATDPRPAPGSAAKFGVRCPCTAMHAAPATLRVARVVHTAVTRHHIFLCMLMTQSGDCACMRTSVRGAE
jgi:hypothetical protein